LKPKINPLNATIMKKNKIAMIGVTFILGAVFGISVITVLSFVSPENPPSPSPDISIITPADANHYFINYYNQADSLKAKFKGFLVDRPQLDAMNALVANNKNIVGFRLYMGQSNTAEKISIVVGLTNTFSDAAGVRIYRTESRNAGPCPFLCDDTSPITKEN
jgi:hypothetical protein